MVPGPVTLAWQDCRGAPVTDIVTLSDGEGRDNARRAADRSASSVRVVAGRATRERALCAPARSTFLFGGCIDRGRADDERR